MTAVTAEASSARDALLACLANAGGPMSRDDISTMTGISLSNVGVVLHRLSRLGLVMAATRGQWELARPEAALAVREPATVRPTRPARNTGPQIDGAKLLDGVTHYAGHFLRMPSRASLDVLVLWAAMTHLRDEDGRLATDASPRLMFLSDAPGSGKSTALEILATLSHNADGLTVEPTEAAFRSVLSRETVLLDEGDVLFGSGKRKESIRAAINAGYTPNGCVKIMDRRQVVKINCFGSLAIAGLDALEKSTGGLLHAILSRSVIVRMHKPEGTGQIPDITCSRAGREAGEQARKLLSLWAGMHREEIVSAEPEMPDQVRLRAAQIWRPLLQIADAAGGQWPGRARAACLELATATPEVPDQDQAEQEVSGAFFDALGRLDDDE